MRANRRLFRLLTSSTASAATANAAARGGATASVLSAISGSSSSEADVTHFKSERGVGLFVELVCSKAVSCQLHALRAVLVMLEFMEILRR